ncbi:MAG: glycoside hydrolase family 16 protein [Anaerolineales bacterium]
MPVGDLPGWRQIFTDDFTDPVDLGEWSDCTIEPMICGGLPESYRDRWWAFLEGWTDQANGLYSPSQVLSVADGVMDIHLHSQKSMHLAAAPVPLIHGRDGSLGQLYGRYAVRFRSDALHGYKVAWLLWPDSETWPRDGEIDFPEGNLDSLIEAYMHRRDATAGNDAAGFSSGVRLSGEWHTAVIEWKKDSVVFILDGRVIGATMDRIPNTPMHWVLEATTTLDGYEPADETEGHIKIDWVAVWKLIKPVE